jgi:phosphoribosylformylglycinamidine synthase subunit PurSL
MLWEVEILPKHFDPEAARVREELALLTISATEKPGIDLASRGYLLEGIFTLETAERLLDELLLDPIAEIGRVGNLNSFATIDMPEHGKPAGRLSAVATVLLKPGVMDPVAESVELAARDLGIELFSVRTFRRYYAAAPLGENTLDLLLRKVLANDAIEQAIEGALQLGHLTPGSEYKFQLVTVALQGLDDNALVNVSKRGQLSLSSAEMKAIQAHFQKIGRDPTDIELETLAQTWSEHCSHKTLKGQIDFDGQRINNLLKDTIFGATQEIRRRLGADDWCVSVFEDNAGVIRFDERFNVCFKVETHNHPSAIEPYGGANTGLGGVIRDPLGTGLGAKPICNTDVFCFAPPDTPAAALPPGVLHPLKIMKGVVAGVRDYGNRMGIPTVNGAVCFDPSYLGNPLVFCGTVGLIPVDRCRKRVEPGDLIVAVGGRTGRDGIHGATFSSIELTSESEKMSGGAVQIGNAITEKKLLDVILQARDRGLYNAITDCGAGGFSSAVGEMGETLGASVNLDHAPLKYQGLTYTEIWISEAQERMVLAVPPKNWDILRMLCQSEDVEATVLGTFEATGKLRLLYQGHSVADLEMDFLHNGRPAVVRQATSDGRVEVARDAQPQAAKLDFGDVLKRILGSLNVCSKEWIIRQYDHEVQGGSVVKPLVGKTNDGPGDAAVVMPVLGSWQGLAIGCGINPHYGTLDAYAMASLAIDEAARNVIAVGADPSRVALLDNFCWGNTERPEVLGSLVRAAQACRDMALAYSMPFISGKDSLNNEYCTPGAGSAANALRHIVIPPTLLISAIGIVPDVRLCTTMDLKEAGNILVLVGTTKDELGGSHYNLVTGSIGGAVPRPDLAQAPRIFNKLHEANRAGLIRSCHDLSEGGLAVAVAEMAFAGNIGAYISALSEMGFGDATALFSESPSRFIIEVTPEKLGLLLKLFGKLPIKEIGTTCKEPRLRIAGASGEWVIWESLANFKEAWQEPLRG